MFWVLTVSPINRMFRTRCQASGPVMKFPHAHETSSQLNGCGGNLHTSKARLDRWDRGIAWWKKAHVMPYACWFRRWRQTNVGWFRQSVARFFDNQPRNGGDTLAPKYNGEMGGFYIGRASCFLRSLFVSQLLISCEYLPSLFVCRLRITVSIHLGIWPKTSLPR